MKLLLYLRNGARSGSGMRSPRCQYQASGTRSLDIQVPCSIMLFGTILTTSHVHHLKINSSQPYSPVVFVISSFVAIWVHLLSTHSNVLRSIVTPKRARLRSVFLR
jgi:hypothetical protein